MEIVHLNDLVGNPLVISLIKKGMKNRKLPQYLLLSGVHGTGKSSTAEIVAMSLTCEQPVEGEACRECDTCKKTILALKPGNAGVSPRVEKINMALVAKNRSMKELLTSTFQVVRSDGSYVKILEEFHQLPEEDQALMLEETARLPSNVYLILTTTHANLILREIESRCLTFNFGRLNRGESTILTDKINRRSKLRAEDYKMIFQRTGGIPRNIVLLVDFLSNNDPTPDEMDALLGNISKEIFLGIFSCIRDFRMYIEIVDDTLAAYSADLIKEKLMDFMIQAVFAFEGGIYDYFTKKDLADLPFKEIETVYKIMKLIESTAPSESDIRVMFLKLRRILAPAMTVYEQKTTSGISSNFKGMTPEDEEGHGLTRANRG